MYILLLYSVYPALRHSALENLNLKAASANTNFSRVILSCLFHFHFHFHSSAPSLVFPSWSLDFLTINPSNNFPSTQQRKKPYSIGLLALFLFHTHISHLSSSLTKDVSWWYNTLCHRMRSTSTTSTLTSTSPFAHLHICTSTLSPRSILKLHTYTNSSSTGLRSWHPCSRSCLRIRTVCQPKIDISIIVLHCDDPFPHPRPSSSLIRRDFAVNSVASTIPPFPNPPTFDRAVAQRYEHFLFPHVSREKKLELRRIDYYLPYISLYISYLLSSTNLSNTSLFEGTLKLIRSS